MNFNYSLLFFTQTQVFYLCVFKQMMEEAN